MANKNRPSFYTGIDSESVRLADNNDPGTTEQRRAWKRAIAQEQEDTKRELGRGATLADLGILDKKEEGRARFNFFGGEEGAKREGEQYGAYAAQKNQQFGHWIPDGQGGFIDPDGQGGVRGRYDQFGRPIGQPYKMGSSGLSRPNGAWGGSGPGTGTPQTGTIDYSGGNTGLLPNYNYSTGNTGVSNSSSVSTPPAPAPYRRTNSGAWGGVPSKATPDNTGPTGQPVPKEYQQGPTMYNNNPTLGLNGLSAQNNPTYGLPVPNTPKTGGVKPSAWGG